MKFKACKDESVWIACANDWLQDELRALKGTKVFNASTVRLFVPAGETPRPLYRSWRENPMLVDESLSFVQVDEVLETSARPFQSFFCEELPTLVDRFEFIDEAERGADLAYLGLGVNGHIAFHEPGISKDFYSGCLRLSSATCERLQLPQKARAVSYGAKAFLKTRAVALLVRGVQKREILKQVLENRGDLPASWLLEHPKLTIITDFQV